MVPMEMKNRIVLLVAIFSTMTSVSAYDATTGTYNQQLRAYHEKLLAYKVQPGRFEAQRKEVCEKLKDLTRQNQNVDALWAKFDALERRANGKDNAYANDCNAFIKEVFDAANKKIAAENSRLAAENAQANEKTAKSLELAKKHKDEQVALMMRNYQPHSGYQYNRRKRIWEELQRCYAQKKNITNHLEQLTKIDTALGNGSVQSLDSQLTALEDSLALPHNIKD